MARTRREEVVCVSLRPQLKAFLKRMVEEGYCSSVSDCVEWLVENFGEELRKRWPE